jgi:hypothetical protein
MKKTAWDGGFIRTNAKGEHVYVLQKRLDGTRWKKTLGVITRDEALAEWLRFKSSPKAYFAEQPPEPEHEEDEPMYSMRRSSPRTCSTPPRRSRTTAGSTRGSG